MSFTIWPGHRLTSIDWQKCWRNSNNHKWLPTHFYSTASRLLPLQMKGKWNYRHDALWSMIIISKNIRSPWKRKKSPMGLLCLLLLFTSSWISYYFQLSLHTTGLFNLWLTFWDRKWIKQTAGKLWIKYVDWGGGGVNTEWIFFLKYVYITMYLQNYSAVKSYEKWKERSVWILLFASYLVFCTSALGIALNHENEFALISLWDQPGEGHSILVVRAGFSFIFIRMH